MVPLQQIPAHCPVCIGSDLQFSFYCKDHSISKEIFNIWDCKTCTLRFTYPIPEEAGIGRYYAADHYISHSDSSKGLINKLYKAARGFTLSEKRRFVQRQTGIASGSLLEVGTGTGGFLNEMETSGWQTTGLEPDFKAREKAFMLYKLPVYEPSHLFQLNHNFFDAITLWHVLEHVYHLHDYLEQFAKLLKPNGLLFIAVPNYTSYDAGHYLDYWAAYDVPRHLYHFSPSSMQKLASLHGFQIIKQKPMWLDPIYISLLSEQYKHGRMRLIPGFLRGFIGIIHSFYSRVKCSSLIYVLKKV
jgi:SAM-dependent methyltransferase